MRHVDLADKLRDARTRVDVECPVEDRAVPKFAQLTRKDTRIRADQEAALTALAKSLMRRRVVRTERITENTLIRVAIDHLLANADALRGSTEDELRNSVTPTVPSGATSAPLNSRTVAGSAVPDFGTSAVRDSGTPEMRALSRAGGAA